MSVHRPLCILLLFLVFLPIVSGCTGHGTDGITVRDYHANLPESFLSDSADPSDVPVSETNLPEDAETDEFRYILNTSSKKIHLPSCSSAKDILPGNEDSTTDLDAAIAAGYSPCGRCKPEA